MFSIRSLSFVLLLAAIEPLFAAEPMPLTASQRKEMQDLLSEFKRARLNTDARTGAIDKLAAIGPLAVRAAEDVVVKDLQR